MSRPRLHDDKFLAFLRTKPCCICGKTGETEACHIRIGFGAMGKKPDDRFATPMCAEHHRQQHRTNELLFWGHHHLNPFEVADRFYTEYGGTGGKPRGPRKSKPRLPKERRARIPTRRGSTWPKRPFARKSKA